MVDATRADWRRFAAVLVEEDAACAAAKPKRSSKVAMRGIGV